MGITDSKCDLIATYTYDEWGKLLSIETAEENNTEQLKVAEANPLRYRGYYYDNETGYYYLQSRYYDPELGRFISADSFNYIDTSTPLSINAYAYCANNPLIYIDSTGCDFTWDTIFKILEISITLDFIFPNFRFTPIKHKTPNMTPSRKPNTTNKKTTIFNCDNLTQLLQL